MAIVGKCTVEVALDGMGSQPVTPRRSRFPVNRLPSPLSPSPYSHTKRKYSTCLDPQSPTTWRNQILSPPYTEADEAGEAGEAGEADEADEADEEVEADGTSLKRARIALHHADTNAAFADIENDIDANTSAHSQLDPQFLPDPSVIDVADLNILYTNQTSTAWDFHDSREGSYNTYEDQAIDSILADPSNDYLGFNASLYDGVDAPESGNDEICFGMIQIDQFELAPNLSLPPSSRNVSRYNNLRLKQSGAVLYKENNSFTHIGMVCAPILRILFHLDQQQGISVQLHCIFQRLSSLCDRRKMPGSTAHLKANLYANLYGPLCALDSIGDFLEDCDIDLQDPEGCDRNVRYRNPHRISGRDEHAPLTVDREITSQRNNIESTSASPDYFGSIAVHSELQMAASPTILKTQLEPYQQQALYFMMTRERGWSFNGPLADIWTQTNIGGVRMYLNSLTDEAQLPAPLPFRGGLLADQMGLGKTLSIISLIASDLYPPQHMMNIDQSHPTNFSSHYSRCTLVIVPPNLLDMWEYELREHCQTGTLRWHRHHDKTKCSSLSQMEPYDVILTTYNTVSTEWRGHKESSILYSCDWHRIVLDEAHYIRGERNQLARAICDLNGYRRWAVTGTPIQNHLNDLQALLKFLRVYPYCEHEAFERDITNLWKIDSDAAMARLKRLIYCITLRRTSNAIRLPPKSEVLFTLPFSPEEREIYEPFELKVTNMANQLSAYGSSTAASRAHALKGLHLLRSICNLGILTDTSKFMSKSNDAAVWGPSDAQSAFETLTMSNATSCTKCTNDATAPNTSMEAPVQEDILSVEVNPVLSQCEQLLCGTCVSSLKQDGQSMLDWCGHVPPCVNFPVSTLKTNLMSSLEPQALFHRYFPTKIKELVKDISLHPGSKSVVFSCWRTTLDLAALGLDSANIKFRRFDGDVKYNDRTSALESFRSDPSIRVLLITMTCGAVGLNLTAADRAYIMEPQWNPTVEDQASSRIHRKGQEKPVTIIRFVMADSIEQRVTEIKSNKKDFAELLFTSKKKASNSGDSRSNFDIWRTLLS